MAGILVCAATAFERDAWPHAGTETLLTRVGIPQTFATLYPRLYQDDLPSLLLNIGIAGAYPGCGLSIGDIAIGGSEVYADIGFELPETPNFQAIGDVAFGAAYRDPIPLTLPDAFVREESSADPAYRVMVGLRGATVNVCTGTDVTGEFRSRRFEAAFETMEGAAVAQIGQSFGIPVCEIRAISNIAARRDMRPENIRLALANLAHYLGRIEAIDPSL